MGLIKAAMGAVGGVLATNGKSFSIAKACLPRFW